VQAELAAIRVAVIPERIGQLMRRGLQQRLGIGSSGAAAAARWELRVSPSLAAEALGIQLDGTATRVRYVATANWFLYRLTPALALTMNGVERTIEAYNIPTNQFFAADSSREAAERRIADILSEEIVLRIAMRFRTVGADGPPATPVQPLDAPAPLPNVSPLGVGTPGLLDPTTGAVGGGFSGGLGSPSMVR
jgi:LPS-assembly lipoprotein